MQIAGRMRIVAIVFSLLLAGCSASHTAPSRNATTTGRAVVGIHWPTRSRMIPFASESIAVKVLQNGALLAQGLLVRPTNGGAASVTFPRLSTGLAIVEAKALPNADGTGNAQAQANATITIVGGEETPVRLSLSSTIDHLEINPALNRLPVGKSARLTVSAKDAANDPVLIGSSTTVFESLTPTTLRVTPDGTVTAIAAGAGQVRVRETESGKTATLTLTQGAATADLFRDFSSTANPNGLWKYGYSGSAQGPIQLFTDKWQDGSLDGWGGLTPVGWHLIGRNASTDASIRDADGKTIIRPLSCWLHPSTTRGPGIAEWTAPANGTYHVWTVFTGDSDTSTGVFVVANGTILFSGSVVGHLNTNTMDQNVSLLAGQTIRFVVTDGGNGDAYDSTGLDAVIEAQ